MIPLYVLLREIKENKNKMISKSVVIAIIDDTIWVSDIVLIKIWSDKMKFKILDLFCGAGVFSYGVDKNKNFQTVLGLDFDQNVINTFNKNIKITIRRWY